MLYFIYYTNIYNLPYELYPNPPIAIIKLMNIGKKDKIEFTKAETTIAHIQYPNKQIHWHKDNLTPKNWLFKLTINPPIQTITNTSINTNPVCWSFLPMDNITPNSIQNIKGPQKSQSLNISGLVPASLAAKKDPVIALRTE